MTNEGLVAGAPAVQARGWRDRSVPVAAACLVCAVAAVVVHMLPSGSGAVDAAKVVIASLTLLFVLGMLILLLCRLESSLTFLELTAGGAAISVGITAFLTMLCMLTQTSFSLAAIALMAGALGLGVAATSRRGGVRLTPVHIPPSEWGLAIALACLGALLFLRGAPMSPGEDQIHVAVARRLAALSHPSVSNIYLTPGLVYTYPFPTTHAVFALTSLIGGVDVLFAYHKLRYLWAIVAIMCVYIVSQEIVRGPNRRRRLRLDGHRAGRQWGVCRCAAPHVGATGAVQPRIRRGDGRSPPSLMVSAFGYLTATQRREQWVYLAAALLMVLALTTGKIREIVQFVVYVGSLLTALLIVGPRRALLRRTVVLLCATLAVVGAYVVYHRVSVRSANEIVDINRGIILTMWRGMTFRDYFYAPLGDGQIINNSRLFYYGINAVVLLGMPVVLLSFRRKRLLLMVWASVFAYFVIVRFPIVSIWSLLSTYFDMLSGPVRNVIFFIYIVTGALVFVAAQLCARLKLWWLGAPALVALAWAVPRAADRLRVVLPEHPGLLLSFVLVTLPLAMWFGATRWGTKLEETCSVPAPPARLATCAAILLLALGVSLKQPHTVLAFGKKPSVHNLEEAIALAALAPEPVTYGVAGSVHEFKAKGTSDVPTPQLVQWMTANVPAETVLATNQLNGNILTTFIPQQVTAWPLLYYHPINCCPKFPVYCQFANGTVEKYGVQPFFNDRESRDERIAFLKAFGVSYVVLDPASEAMMQPTLIQHPDLFTEVYGDAGWRVFKVSKQGL